MTTQFDRRVTPARPDMAAAQLKGLVDAPRFVEGVHEEVVVEIADLRSRPTLDAPLDSQALRGERFTVYEIEEGWAWGQLERDSYVGFLPAAALAPERNAPTHRVAVLRTFLYPGTSMKLPVEQALPLNGQLAVSEMIGDFARIGEEGFVWAGHLAPLRSCAQDFVSVAEQFTGLPYLWGGKTALGLDCSGLVQTSLAAAGIHAPRDTDMQENSMGHAISLDSPLQRGDLIFWKGHVGIMRDAENLLHANGFHMLVASEPLTVAASRIASNSFGKITSIRRLNSLNA